MALESPNARFHLGSVPIVDWSESYTDPTTTIKTLDYDIRAYARKNVIVTSTCDQTIDLVVYGAADDTFDDLVTINSQTIAVGNVTKQNIAVPFTDHYRYLRITLDPAANATGALDVFVQGQGP